MNLLTNLEITKVAFVDAGANPGADILIYKRKADEPASTKKGSIVADEKIDKALAEKVLRLETENAAAKETLDALSAMDNETLAALRGFEIAKVEKSDEDVLKSLPAEVRERIEKAEKAQAASEERIAKMEQERRTEQFTKAASEYGNIAPAQDLAPVLEAVDRLDPEVAKQLTPILKAANARIAEGNLFSEFGKTGDDSDPYLSVVAKAAELRKENPDLSEAEAKQAAMAASPEAAREAFSR